MKTKDIDMITIEHLNFDWHDTEGREYTDAFAEVLKPKYERRLQKYIRLELGDWDESINIDISWSDDGNDGNIYSVTVDYNEDNEGDDDEDSCFIADVRRIVDEAIESVSKSDWWSVMEDVSGRSLYRLPEKDDAEYDDHRSKFIDCFSSGVITRTINGHQVDFWLEEDGEYDRWWGRISIDGKEIEGAGGDGGIVHYGPYGQDQYPFFDALWQSDSNYIDEGDYHVVAYRLGLVKEPDSEDDDSDNQNEATEAGREVVIELMLQAWGTVGGQCN